MYFECFNGITRTGRFIATSGWKCWWNDPLVYFYGDNQQRSEAGPLPLYEYEQNIASHLLHLKCRWSPLCFFSPFKSMRNAYFTSWSTMIRWRMFFLYSEFNVRWTVDLSHLLDSWLHISLPERGMLVFSSICKIFNLFLVLLKPFSCKRPMMSMIFASELQKYTLSLVFQRILCL